MKISLIISVLFIMATHPFSMLITLVMMTMLIASFIYMCMKSLWFSFILILLILGGMLVLFVYITSLAPNKKFKIKKWFIFFLFPIFLLEQKQPSFFPISAKNIFQFNFNHNSFLLIFITIYLLMTLLAVMKMINSSLAPLRLSF
uniref:NADH dehydrogenase subunit 6 n=1 Tax=Ogadenus brumpti TaxID=1827023 RepID=A0A1P8AG17_9ACAR|nr:NADH dehydrogenase subunit 6 [Ogadenus brumpti]AMX74050.1 NADH dehydrogenase subunit 6 [Ogadenus brumpti]AMX74063.1 NADH dehydrogenase subunit 6 [Ogadenus brumpti]